MQQFIYRCRDTSTHATPLPSTRESFSFAAAIVSLCGLLLVLTPLRGRAASLAEQLGLHGGKQIYQAACVACHGEDGAGTPEITAGFTRPDTFPHFNGCDETTPESTRDWKAVIRDGGAGRGFSRIMPAFGQVLTSTQIDELVTYLRSFCAEPGWPVGELNLPRALFTEKAFPESEIVLTTSVNARGPPGIANELAFEKILGKRDQLEVAIPFGWTHQDTGGSYGGLGDIAVGLKHVLFARLDTDDSQPPYRRTGSILSIQGEISLPTGDVAHQLGSGETSLGVFAAYDAVLPARAFLQLQMGIDLPFHTDDVPRSAFFRSAVGRSFSGDMELGRLWTPMIELVADRDLIAGATTQWDAVPEFQVTLNRRQHVRVALGYRLPLNERADRPRMIVLYALWDWFDGGLLEGWR